CCARTIVTTTRGTGSGVELPRRRSGGLRACEPLRLLEMNCGGNPASMERLLAETRLHGQLRHGVAAPEMRVEDDFGDRENASGFERIEELLKRRLAIRNFPQHRHQQSSVEAIVFQLSLAQPGAKKADRRLDTERAGLLFNPGQHGLLYI